MINCSWEHFRDTVRGIRARDSRAGISRSCRAVLVAQRLRDTRSKRDWRNDLEFNPFLFTERPRCELSCVEASSTHSRRLAT